MNYRTVTTLCATFAAAISLATMTTAALANNLQKEIKTAATHAGYAAGSDKVKTVHTHLHHAVNCIVGPKGDGFDSSVLDPCKGMGNGALSDARKDEKTTKALDSALEAARSGLAADTLGVAQKDAKKAAADLKTAMPGPQ